MHTSNQLPEEQPEIAEIAEAGTKTSEQVSNTADRPMNAQDVGANIDHEAIRHGRIYPPPPSFYQKEDAQESSHTSSALAPVPQPLQTGSSIHSNQENYVPLPQVGNTQAPPHPSYPPQHTFPTYSTVQGYPGPQAPYGAPHRPKKSYKWVWILVSVLSVLILASCGICVWASSSLFGSAFQQASTVVYGGRDLTNNYYEAIQNKRYSQAYSYLSTQGALKNLTPAQYLQQAQSLDEQYGPVYKYVAGTPSVSYDPSGTNIDHFTIPVDVTRKKKSYQVLLTMYKIHDQWKITDYTTI
jgi:hypothetical protein